MWVPISFPKDDVLINWWSRKRYPFTDSEPVPNGVIQKRLSQKGRAHTG